MSIIQSQVNRHLFLQKVIILVYVNNIAIAALTRFAL